MEHQDPVEEAVVTLRLTSHYAGRVGPALTQLRELLVSLTPEMTVQMGVPGWDRHDYGYTPTLRSADGR
jgi:hypothetical protein